MIENRANLQSSPKRRRPAQNNGLQSDTQPRGRIIDATRSPLARGCVPLKPGVGQWEKTMKLRALTISNFATIGEPGLTIPIDDIVVLIGPNNSGKSSVLNAYEAFASTGSALSLKAFRDEDPSKTISIDGLFTDLSDNDRETLGAKWEYDDPTYGKAVRAKWEWTVPDQKAQKYSWDNAGGKWISGGMGGWDTLITSRIPVPLRVRPTDDPEETEKQIVEILTAAAKEALKKDASKAASVLKELQTLADEFAKDAQKELDDALISLV